MGNKTTTTPELDRMGVFLLGRCFRGAVPADSSIPETLKPGECCIVNTHNSWQPGEHWLALARDRAKGMIAYDSFGRRVASWATDSELDPEQAVSELNCGQRCLAWLACWKKHGADVALSI